MKVRDAMTQDVRIAGPEQPIREAAQTMAEMDVGALPVGEDDQLLGMITDRDIAVRAVANGMPGDIRVSEVMTRDIRYCFDDQDVDQVCQNLGDQQIRRIPVVNRDKRLVGILSLGDLALSEGRDKAAEALAGISRPGGAHTQTGGARA